MNEIEATISIDKDTGELRILGRRHLAIDADSLCAHLNQLTGQGVAEVIIRQHEYRLGKEDVEEIRRQRPNVSLREIVDIVQEAERVSGVGVVKVDVPPDRSQPVQVEISNPCVKVTVGAGKALLSSYWCGVFSQLFNGECEAEELAYDKAKDVLKFRIVMRK